MYIRKVQTDLSFSFINVVTGLKFWTLCFVLFNKIDQNICDMLWFSVSCCALCLVKKIHERNLMVAKMANLINFANSRDF